jgi:hypothetical protein
MARSPLTEIVNALGFATRPRFHKEDDLFGRTRRLTVSAGALHSISILIIPGRDDLRLYRYDSTENCLDKLNAKTDLIEGWFIRAGEILPEANGTAIFLVSDTAIPDAVYERCNSLVWRDAGALLQTLALVSTAYSLTFCPLGLLGSEVVEAVAGSPRLVAVGSALIGKESPVPGFACS